MESKSVDQWTSGHMYGNVNFGGNGLQEPLISAVKLERQEDRRMGLRVRLYTCSVVSADVSRHPPGSQGSQSYKKSILAS